MCSEDGVSWQHWQRLKRYCSGNSFKAACWGWKLELRDLLFFCREEEPNWKYLKSQPRFLSDPCRPLGQICHSPTIPVPSWVIYLEWGISQLRMIGHTVDHPAAPCTAMYRLSHWIALHKWSYCMALNSWSPSSALHGTAQMIAALHRWSLHYTDDQALHCNFPMQMGSNGEAAISHPRHDSKQNIEQCAKLHIAHIANTDLNNAHIAYYTHFPLYTLHIAHTEHCTMHTDPIYWILNS